MVSISLRKLGQQKCVARLLRASACFCRSIKVKSAQYHIILLLLLQLLLLPALMAASSQRGSVADQESIQKEWCLIAWLVAEVGRVSTQAIRVRKNPRNFAATLMLTQLCILVLDALPTGASITLHIQVIHKLVEFPLAVLMVSGRRQGLTGTQVSQPWVDQRTGTHSHTNLILTGTR